MAHVPEAMQDSVFESFSRVWHVKRQHLLLSGICSKAVNIRIKSSHSSEYRCGLVGTLLVHHIHTFVVAKLGIHTGLCACLQPP